MTIDKYKDDYFTKHIPHRINLLITFRERYGKNPPLDPEIARDFFRCSKDISMLMVRFLLGELGIKLQQIEKREEKKGKKQWSPPFGIQPLTIEEVKKDSRCENIKKVLKAANRAVAHIVEKDVNHTIGTNEILIDAIDFTEEMVIKKMYIATGHDYQKIMAIPCNDMERKEIFVNLQYK